MSDAKKKINLGCGPVGKDDWVNIDWGILAFLHKFTFIENILLNLKLLPKGYNVRWPRNLKLHNCKRKLPFATYSLDYVYTSHLIEHFKKFDAESILKDCCRVLKKGGIIRVVVPDLELLVKKYLENDRDYFKKINALMNFAQRDYSGENLVLADVLMENFYPLFYKNKPLGMQRLFTYFIRPHYWMYDYPSLESLLRSAGFANIQRRKFREGRVPGLESLDVLPEMSLYVEAEK
ncbi:MAG: methyltransferase domain-containing protein [Candidatus Omnitrophota bacterium]